ncbi:N-acetylmuramoyl-L-alanine amidase [Antrihabitans sp. YC2-6]|uniref:N-acetylmuramoyl-L-alanine amidase n=1 Tax=Antrihabitans sp. YC2-6 TaxID=2799498 RepID=UPI0018F6B002|nr:N-acetylmuramoyl-L-alanine amidase [Antrihabitans sp. YC2-6]MBJ8346269.1 LGFP repeat-containing protein [Antrihabitans sp. YC2-6]
MPHRRPKPSIVLGAVAALAVASPFAAYTLGSSPSGVTETNDTTDAIPTQIASVVLAALPDIVIPLRQLTGLDLPDLHLGDLKKLPIPAEIPLPNGLPSLPIPDLDALTGPGSLLPDQLPPGVIDTYGTTVKEVSRDTPFSMIAITASDLANADAKVRVKLPNGEWGPWWSTEQIDTRKTDATPAGGKSGTEPVYVGNTNAAQVLIARKTLAAPVPGSDPAHVPVPDAPAADAGQPLGYTPASMSRPLHETPAQSDDMSVVLIDPGSNPNDANLSDVASALPDGGPKVISRAKWGADEDIRCQDPEYDDFVSGATVHHTAGNNDYSRSESAEIVRAIYAYHAETLDWCDIGYNALVDKYGQIFEGRYGGLDEPVQGAHAGGFNENTVGVAMMGNFEEEAPTNATLEAIGKFIGWRLKIAGIDPLSETTMYSEGTEFTPYAEGEEVDLPVIFAHRDVGNTECPGDAAYAELDTIREIAEATSNGETATLAGDSGESGQSQPIDPGTSAPADALPATEPPADEPPATELQVDVVPAEPAPAVIPPVESRPEPATNEDLRRLVTEMVRLGVNHPISDKWLADGGENSNVGTPLTPISRAKDGFEFVKFTNGFIYTAPGGKVVTVLGKIMQQFVATGLDSGLLGLPLTDEFPVPEGMRADFELGYMVFNKATGFVTTMLKTYNNSYEEAYTG